MRKFNLILGLLLLCTIAGAQENFWMRVNEAQVNKNLFANRFKPDAYQLFQLNESSLVNVMKNVPSERSVSSSASGFIVSVPNSVGQIEKFRVVEAPVMDPALAARYPDIKSYAGTGLDDPSSTIRFDISPSGFHGMILSADRPTIYIDPVDRNDKYYVVFARKDVAGIQKKFNCLTPASITETTLPVDHSALRAADDGRLRTYRLALACTGEYAQYFLNGTETTDAQRKAKVLTAMNTLLVRTNAIYERDFGIRMNLIANNDALIYLSSSTDPWSNEWNIKTQQTIDAVIGNANYDIGHLVHKEASASNNNGNAGCIACVCKTWNGSTNPNTFIGKGGGFTSHVAPEGDPFVVDYTTHEMGHQFGANHTFTFSNETGTASQFEPGSGSTIMGYAGITGATDVQPHSDDYFHARSVEQISDYIKSGTGGGACPVVTITGNTAPVPNAGADFTIPKSTPFTLTGSATDVDAGDVLVYTWEQTNAGTSSTTNPSTTATSGPLFRSRTGNTSPSRTFPILSSILDGTNGNQWERLPGVARTLSFRLVVRDNHAGGGNTKDDDLSVVISTAGPFAVTAPNTAITWAGGSSQAITWSVNSTNVAPVNCANVKISLSTDGGLTFPAVLTASTPNDGIESLIIPNTPTSTARIKVEAVGNIFFDISNTNFTIGTGSSCNAPATLTSSSVTNNSATISWTAASGAVSYDVDYKTNASATWINAATGTTSLSVNLTSLTASTLYDWRVRTNCSSGSSSYATAQFTTLVTPSGCLTAFEPNGTQATAASVAVNTPLSAAIDASGDIDYYTFTTTASSNLNITLGNLPGDYDLFLYNSGGTQIGASEAGGTTSEAIVLNNQAAGTYYVRVIGYNGAFSTTVCYNLNIGSTIITGCSSSFDVSTNGTSGGAALIPFNTNVTGLISPSGDNDYYKFVITTGGTATITLTTLPGDYDMRLYSSNGTTQLAISENGGTTSETISRTYTAGTYYVRVYGFNNANSATSCYTLRVALGTATRGELYTVNTPKQKIDVFPNPSSRSIKVNLTGIEGKSEIIVTDINGKVVLRKQVSSVTSVLDISRFASGLYLVSVKNNGKEVSSTKIIKE
ncbi:MAG: reprolysin-like metallopeptidase [Chitinophagaceae bacterium]